MLWKGPRTLHSFLFPQHKLLPLFLSLPPRLSLSLSLSTTRVVGPPFTSPLNQLGSPSFAARIPLSILLSRPPSTLVRSFLGLLFYPPPTLPTRATRYLNPQAREAFGGPAAPASWVSTALRFAQFARSHVRSLFCLLSSRTETRSVTASRGETRRRKLEASPRLMRSSS